MANYGRRFVTDRPNDSMASYLGLQTQQPYAPLQAQQDQFAPTSDPRLLGPQPNVPQVLGALPTQPSVDPGAGPQAGGPLSQVLTAASQRSPRGQQMTAQNQQFLSQMRALIQLAMQGKPDQQNIMMALRDKVGLTGQSGGSF